MSERVTAHDRLADAQLYTVGPWSPRVAGKAGGASDMLLVEQEQGSLALLDHVYWGRGPLMALRSTSGSLTETPGLAIKETRQIPLAGVSLASGCSRAMDSRRTRSCGLLCGVRDGIGKRTARRHRDACCSCFAQPSARHSPRHVRGPDSGRCCVGASGKQHGAGPSDLPVGRSANGDCWMRARGVCCAVTVAGQVAGLRPGARSRALKLGIRGQGAAAGARRGSRVRARWAPRMAHSAQGRLLGRSSPRGCRGDDSLWYRGTYEQRGRVPGPTRLTARMQCSCCTAPSSAAGSRCSGRGESRADEDPPCPPVRRHH